MPSNIFPKCKDLTGKGLERYCIKYKCNVDAKYCNGCGGEKVCPYEFLEGNLIKCSRFKWIIGEVGVNSHKVCKICRNKNFHSNVEKKPSS